MCHDTGSRPFRVRLAIPIVFDRCELHLDEVLVKRGSVAEFSVNARERVSDPPRQGGTDRAGPVMTLHNRPSHISCVCSSMDQTYNALLDVTVKVLL